MLDNKFCRLVLKHGIVLEFISYYAQSVNFNDTQPILYYDSQQNSVRINHLLSAILHIKQFKDILRSLERPWHIYQIICHIDQIEIQKLLENKKKEKGSSLSFTLRPLYKYTVPSVVYINCVVHILIIEDEFPILMQINECELKSNFLTFV